MSIEENERLKYNLAHKNEEPFHHKRQLNELKVCDSFFHKKWRECVENNLFFLDVGVGAGTVLKHFHDNGINYLGVDISDDMIKKLSKLGLNCKTMSCHNMNSISDESFDVVQHLDGMEHIPVEWEVSALKEEIRVAKKYVFHANAMGDAWLDRLTISHNLGPVHVNIKNSSEWDSFYKKNSSLGYTILHSEVIHDTYFVVLKKGL